MKEGMVLRKKVLSVVLIMVLMFSIMPATAYADIGPKPSVLIDFRGLDGEIYYVTLLSEIKSTGPHSVLGDHPNNQRYHSGDEDYEIWEKFVSYKDEDGYYFLQFFMECTETSQFKWGYYPPPKFKILLYFPEYDQFAVSHEPYERYAFDSYYSVDVEGLEIQSVIQNDHIKAVKNYDYRWELISLMARITGTVAIEVLIAFFFGFRSKKQLLRIGFVNVLTQSILNILLNITNYKHGSWMFVVGYIWMEILVLLIEIVAYSILLKNIDAKMQIKRSIPIYAMIANGASFGIGLIISYLIPGIF